MDKINGMLLLILVEQVSAIINYLLTVDYDADKAKNRLQEAYWKGSEDLSKLRKDMEQRRY